MAQGAWYVRALALGGALAALVPAVAMWGFTVDDALIPLRYAHHLASGHGYRFDANGPVTDGVTPLPWAVLLAPLAAGPDLLDALERVKAAGAVAWTLAGAALGVALARRSARRLDGAIALGVVALAFPVGAWAASGMETGVATALATLAAVSFDRPLRAAALAGLAATLRPELVVWAAVLAAGAAVARSPLRAPGGAFDARAVRRAILTALAAVAPFAACTVVRVACFGRPAPLALMAKPSDLRHGLVYGAAASVVVLTPLLACAPLALLRASPLARTVVVAAVAHVAVVVGVGGDWMPYARLLVPVAPSLALAYVALGHCDRAWSRVARAVAALAVGAFVLRSAPPGRGVHEARKQLVARARPELESARVVAALDVGWVGAATGARIVDLAGLTDPEVAALPGGHTSKKVDAAMLLDRGVDTVVVYGEPRIVERRLLASALFDERFVKSATIEFGARQRYDLYRRR